MSEPLPVPGEPLLRWTSELPTLREPVLLIALEGFVDAGAVASTASMFLRHRWRASQIATFDRDTLLDYRARRPTAVVDAGQLRRIEWPTIELLAAQVDGPHDVISLLGPEPDMGWQAFCAEVAEVCRALGVVAAIGLGAYPAAVPHTRPVRIQKAANTAEGGLEVDAAGDIPGYTGPVGAGTTLQAELAAHDIPAVGLWTEVPHYISGSPNPAGALAMVRLVTRTLGTTVDVAELEAAATSHAEQVDEAVAEHPEAAELVEALERHLDDDDDDQDVPSGDAMAAEIERFLRSQGDE